MFLMNIVPTLSVKKKEITVVDSLLLPYNAVNHNFLVLNANKLIFAIPVLVGSITIWIKPPGIKFTGLPTPSKFFESAIQNFFIWMR